VSAANTYLGVRLCTSACLQRGHERLSMAPRVRCDLTTPLPAAGANGNHALEHGMASMFSTAVKPE